MSERSSYRRERIERLLHEVEYEITRGVMDREIGEEMSFEFIIPISEQGEGWVTQFVARLRPTPAWQMHTEFRKLRLVEKD